MKKFVISMFLWISKEGYILLVTKDKTLPYRIMTSSAVFFLMFLIKDSTQLPNIVLKDENFEMLKNFGKFIVWVSYRIWNIKNNCSHVKNFEYVMAIKHLTLCFRVQSHFMWLWAMWSKWHYSDGINTVGKRERLLDWWI